ncbi:MAG: hypothetical protein K2H98_08630, partial [Duncaniella sp.]|nr:hypothetical protein [Duncaniella sp.]
RVRRQRQMFIRDSYRMYDALVDIFNCEDDLESHADIENHILIPMIASMEKRPTADSSSH